MRRPAVAALAILTTAGAALAQNVEINVVDGVGCKSLDTAKALAGFVASGDRDTWKREVKRHMADGQCALLNPGARIVITDRALGSFRFRFDGQSDLYWVAQ